MRNPSKVAKQKKQKNMENFNELFENAKMVADRRKTIFNKLINETKEMLPAYCQAIKTLGYNEFLFDQQLQTIVGQNEESDSGSEKSFPVLLHSNGTISECKWDFDGYNDCAVPVNTYTIQDVKLTKIGIISFVKQLNYKLKVMTEKREAQNKTAEELLKK